MSDIYFLDNTRISSFKACPSAYAMRHELDWTKDTSKAALDFGGCWHEGMAAVFKNLSSAKSHTELATFAKEGFQAEWYHRGLCDVDNIISMDDLYPRVPGVAFEMYSNYLESRWDWLQTIDVLSVEAPFCVPLIDDNKCYICGTDTSKPELLTITNACSTCGTMPIKVFLVGRRDAVIQTDDGIWVLEHKTSSLYSVDYGFQWKFTTSFSPNSQVDGYSYANLMDYGDKARGVYINAALVHKKRHDIFKTLPIYRSLDLLESWYDDTTHWVKELITHKHQKYWPHNTSSCFTQYGACEFRDICEISSDPFKLPVTPMGYKVEHWEPFDEKTLESLIAA